MLPSFWLAMLNFDKTKSLRLEVNLCGFCGFAVARIGPAACFGQLDQETELCVHSQRQ